MAWMRFIMFVLALAFAAPAAAQTRLPPDGFADLAERLTPAVVNIATSQRVEGVDELPRFPRGSPLERFNEGHGDGAAQVTSLGSGFIISADGVVVTNNHVIEAADTIEVILQNGERLEAAVIGRDPATDLAVLRVRTRAPLPYVHLGDSDEARVGDLVLAIGNPFGLGGTVTIGIVSARNRNIDAGRYDDFIQTDASINRGNSGGPLFNMNGEVIGVNTAIVSPSGASVGVGFATPAAIVRPVVEQLLRYGETRRGWLGVRLANPSADAAEHAGVPRGRGAVITRLTAGGPAEAAGLRPGDLVLSFDGREVADSRALTRMVGEAQIGKRVAIEVFRNGRRMSVDASIGRLAESAGAEGARPGQAPPTAPPRQGASGARVLGMALSELDAGLREQFQIEPDVEGLVVMDVDPESDADGKVRVGDVIEAMAFAPMSSISAARAIAGRAAVDRRAIVVKLNRDGAITFRSVRAGG